jgi:DNA repair protein RadA
MILMMDISPNILTRQLSYRVKLSESLRKCGLLHVNDLAFGNTYVISKLLSLNLSETRELQRAAISRVHDRSNSYSITTAYNTFQIKTPRRFSTGLLGLDNLLGGGIESSTITQIYGEPRTCKTQICFAVCAHMPEDTKVIYIDTECKFRPERIMDLAISRNLHGNEILKRILVSRPFDSRQQEETVQNSYSQVKRDPKIKLIILDSMTNHYLAEYPGRKFLQERISKLNVQIQILLSIARVNDIAVIITNRPQTKMADDYLGAKELTPYGGSSLSSTSSYIVQIERISNNNVFTAKLVKSPIHPVSAASFAITNSVIEDSTDQNRNLSPINYPNPNKIKRGFTC